MKASGTRNYFEVRVGDHQSAEIILYLRRRDVSWFNNENARVFPDFLHLLEQLILPRLFGDEMEETEATETNSRIPPPLGPGGMPVAEKNAPAPTKKRKRMTKKAIAELKRLEDEEARKAKRKDFYYAYGKYIQLTYRLQQVKNNRGETLIFGDSPKKIADTRTTGKDQMTGALVGNFHQLHKLSKQIVVWCYPLEESKSPANPDPAGGGFPRPELIPTADLFRDD